MRRFSQGLTAVFAVAAATAMITFPASGVSSPNRAMVRAHMLRAASLMGARATANLSPATVTPVITLNSTTASPGAVVEVKGTGFGKEELVTLALDGAAVPGTPTEITTASGTFTARVTMPTSLLHGANTISAFGAKTRTSAVATLNGTLPTATTLFFAGIRTDDNTKADMPILNANNQTAHVDLFFYYEPNGTAHAIIDIPAHSRGTADLNRLGGVGLHFGIKLVSKIPVTAEVRLNRPGRDGATMMGVAAPQTTWYLAEGFTGLTFHEIIWLVNPGTVASNVTLHLLPFGGHPAKTESFTVKPQTMFPADVNSVMPDQSVSAIVNASVPIVVARSETFSNNRFGLTEKPGANATATSWIFAEGTTTTRFQAFLTILNPHPATAQVTASFFGKTGNSLGTRTLVVPPVSRANLKFSDFLHATDIASVVTSNLPIVVERPIYFGSPNDPKVAGSDVFGRNGAALSWTFPGGNTAERNEFLLIYNTSAKTVDFDAIFHGDNGTVTTKRLAAAPGVRSTVNVNTLVPGVTAQHSVTLQAINKEGFVAEQTIFASDFSTLSTTEGFAR